MSITSSLFRKAVKVLKRRTAQATRGETPATPLCLIEPLEQRLLLTSTLTVERLDDGAEEANETGSFRITRTDTSGDLTVNFSLLGTADFGAVADYTLSDGVNNLTDSVVIPDGASTVDVIFTPREDAGNEPIETVTLKLEAGDNYDVHVLDNTATALIIDNDDAVPTVSIEQTTNGAEGGADAVFTLTRDITAGALTVMFSRSGTATHGSDYILLDADMNVLTNSITFADGVGSVTITVDVTDDASKEKMESVIITLPNQPQTIFTTYQPNPLDNTATATIADNDPAVPSVQLVAATEGAEGGANATFTVTRSDGTGQVDIKFTRSGTATFNSDYTLLGDGVSTIIGNNTIRLPDGVTSATINIVPVDDAKAEADETVKLTLATGTGYTVDPSQSSDTTVIFDNEPTVGVIVLDSIAEESGDPATNVATFRITREDNTSGPLEVKFSLSGSAKRGATRDYTILVDGNLVTGNSITIPNGDSFVDIVVSPFDDTFFEDDETVTLTLKSSSAYKIDPEEKSGVVVIEDNAPFVYINPQVSAVPTASITTNTPLGAETFIQNGTQAGESHDSAPDFRVYDASSWPNPLRGLEVRNATDVNFADSRKAYIKFDLDELPFDDYSQAEFAVTLYDVAGFTEQTTWTFNVYGLRDNFVPEDPDTEFNEDWTEDIDYSDAPGNGGDGGNVDLDDMFSNGPLGSFQIVGTGVIGQRYSFSSQALADFLNNESTFDLDGDNTVTFIITRENVGNKDTETIVHSFDDLENGFGGEDTLPTLTVIGVETGLVIPEDDSLTIRIFRTGNDLSEITIPFRVQGSAKMGFNKDYILRSVDEDANVLDLTNAITIPAGDLFIDLLVQPIDDDVFELAEELTIFLQPHSSYNLDRGNDEVTVTIIDNEAVVTVEATDEDAEEPDLELTLDEGTFTFTRSSATDNPLVLDAPLEVFYKVTGTARNGTDYVNIFNSVVIPAGSDTVDVVISPLADTIPEGVEDVTVTLVKGPNYGLQYIMRGSRSQTGSEISPQIIYARNEEEARKVAKLEGVSGPRFTPEMQSDSVFISNGIPQDGPDLVVLALMYSAREFSIGDPGAPSTARATIRNQGNQAAGTFTVSLYLVDTRTGVGELLDSLFVTSLNRFTSTNVTFTYNPAELPMPVQGEYFLRVQVDPANFVDETIDTNNTFYTHKNNTAIVA